MVSIALVEVVRILKNYKYKKGFYRYWKTCCTNELYRYITSNSIMLNGEVPLNDDEDYVGVFASTGETASDGLSESLLKEQIRNILFNPNNKFSMLEIELYLMEMEKGYSRTEIADIYGLKYHTVRSKNERTIGRVKNILLNSKK